MRIDNFTTARCKKCGWIKQFQPDREHELNDFECNCKVVVDELSQLKAIADKKGIKYPANIGIATLTKKIEEA